MSNEGHIPLILRVRNDIVILQGILFVEILRPFLFSSHGIIRVSHVYWSITVSASCADDIRHSPPGLAGFPIFGASSKPARTSNGKPVKCVSNLALPLLLLEFYGVRLPKKNTAF